MNRNHQNYHCKKHIIDELTRMLIQGKKYLAIRYLQTVTEFTPREAQERVNALSAAIHNISNSIEEEKIAPHASDS